MISANLNNAGHQSCGGRMLINTGVNNGQTTAADTYQLLSQKDMHSVGPSGANA